MQVEFDPRRRSHRVAIDRQLPELDPATVRVLNLNQMTSSTVIRDNVMRPCVRNAMLVRAQRMRIAGNQLDGTRGGVMGLNFTHSSGDPEQAARRSKNTHPGNLVNGGRPGRRISISNTTTPHAQLQHIDPDCELSRRRRGRWLSCMRKAN